MKKVIFSFCLLISSIVYADTLKIYIAFPPGGSIDGFGRELQKEFSKIIPNVVVLNRPGGDGVVAAKEFLNTDENNNKIFLLGSGTTVYYKLLKNYNLSYDPILDFDMIGPLSRSSLALTVDSESNIHNLSELINLAQKQSVNCGTNSLLGTFFLKYVNDILNTQFNSIPYKGGSELVVAVKGGHVQCAIDGYPIVFRNNNVRILGVSTEEQSKTSAINVIVPEKNNVKFEVTLAVALHEKMNPLIRTQVTETLTNLYKNRDSVNYLNSRGHQVPQAKSKYQLVMQQEYLKLEQLRTKYSILKE